MPLAYSVVFPLAALCLIGAILDGCVALDQGRMRRSPSDESDVCSDVISPVPPQIVKKYRLRGSFYKKYITVYGFPIMGSDNVDDRALQRACYTVRFVLAGSKKLRDGMRLAKARAAIIGSKEKIFEVPEYSRFSKLKSWITRRGTGGTLYRPVTVGAQENLLSEDSDAYGQNEDIFLHEFAHAVHLIACYIEYPFFNKRVSKAFDDARKANLWDNTYSATNNREYFAMGMQSYLNQQREGPVGGDGVCNNINNRTELMHYDRALYDLIEEILSCPNNYIPKSTDRDQIQASSQVLEMDCDRVEPDYTDFDCEDDLGVCSKYVSRCRTVGYVAARCRKTCGKC